MRANFAKAAAAGDEAPLYFYSHLFLSHPEVRSMFPVSMAHQRDRLFRALGDVVSMVDDLPSVVPILQQLGRDHRKFGAQSAHYPAGGASLLATLEHFDDEWTPELAKSWSEAYTIVAQVMVEAAEADADGPPVGHFALDNDSDRDLLLVGGGTGWAPLKAMIDQVARQGPPRRVDLFLGARTEERFYDLAEIRRLDQEHPWLTVVLAVSEDKLSSLEQGNIGDVMMRHGPWLSRDVYVAGSHPMVDDTVARLTQHGLPPDRIHTEVFAPSRQSPSLDGEVTE